MYTRRSATALLAALVGITALSACGSSGSTADTSGSSAVPVTSTASSGTVDSSSPTSAMRSTSTTVAVAVAGAGCVAARLQISLGESGAAAGNRYQTVLITNNGSAECTLKGFPGVSLLDASGARIGQPATREAGDATKVSLAATGGQASFFIHTTADLGGIGCQPPSATIAVIAPNDTETISVDGEITVCGSFSVGPVVAGTTGHA